MPHAIPNRCEAKEQSEGVMNHDFKARGGIAWIDIESWTNQNQCHNGTHVAHEGLCSNSSLGFKNNRMLTFVHEDAEPTPND